MKATITKQGDSCQLEIEGNLAPTILPLEGARLALQEQRFKRVAGNADLGQVEVYERPDVPGQQVQGAWLGIHMEVLLSELPQAHRGGDMGMPVAALPVFLQRLERGLGTFTVQLQPPLTHERLRAMHPLNDFVVIAVFPRGRWSSPTDVAAPPKGGLQ